MKTDLNNLKDIDDATPLIKELEKSKPEDGIFRRYWSNGNLRYEWEYKDGKRVDGVSKGWYLNGQIKQTMEWKNGSANELWVEYNEGIGTKLVEGYLKNNCRVGKWNWWNDWDFKIDGVVYAVGEKIIRTDVFGDEGGLISSVIYFDEGRQFLSNCCGSLFKGKADGTPGWPDTDICGECGNPAELLEQEEDSL
jgi:hypothetical protein